MMVIYFFNYIYLNKLFLESVQLAFKRRAEFHGENNTYQLKNLTKKFFIYIFSFIENIDRITDKNYLPTNKDILLMRVSTTGVVKLTFTFNNLNFM